MNTLILDSSTSTLYAAVIVDDKVYEKYINGRNDHAKNIVSSIDLLLGEAGLTVDNLDRIIIGYGPGSYTGVRMSVTVGKMMAVFKNIPLYTISTLKLMASGYDGVVKASIDARRGNAFSGVFDINNNVDILAEGLYSYETLEKYEASYSVKDGEFKVNPFKVIEISQLVDEPHLLVPNYLRDTEAERNAS